MRTLNNNNFFFFDIETVSRFPDYDSLPDIEQSLWHKKSKRMDERSFSEPNCVKKSYLEKSAIFAEFGKIITISTAYFPKKTSSYPILKSFSGTAEDEILSLFFEHLYHVEKNKKNITLCGHNIREFDIPYICRRAMVNGLKIHPSLNFSGKKPWEITSVYDTMEMWKFGDYKNFTSLETLAYLFNIPSPKSQLSGEKVGDTYWKENNLKKIVDYCEKDVVTLVKLTSKIFGFQSV